MRRNFILEIEKFFKVVSSTGISSENREGLAILKDNMEFSKVDSRDYNVTFTSSNPVTGSAAQVFLHTLAIAKKLKRMNVFSCSLTPSVTPELVGALKKYGYKVETPQGTDEIEIRFADNVDPISLKSITCADKALPTEVYRGQGGNHFVQ